MCTHIHTHDVAYHKKINKQRTGAIKRRKKQERQLKHASAVNYTRGKINSLVYGWSRVMP